MCFENPDIILGVFELNSWLLTVTIFITVIIGFIYYYIILAIDNFLYHQPDFFTCEI